MHGLRTWVENSSSDSPDTSPLCPEAGSLFVAGSLCLPPGLCTGQDVHPGCLSLVSVWCQVKNTSLSFFLSLGTECGLRGQNLGAGWPICCFLFFSSDASGSRGQRHLSSHWRDQLSLYLLPWRELLGLPLWPWFASPGKNSVTCPWLFLLQLYQVLCVGRMIATSRGSSRAVSISHNYCPRKML